jgi:hypothetical protein
MIIGAGAGGAALLLTGGIWRVMAVPQRAYRPWDLSDSPPADVRLDAFRHAILAPNPHNRQPWLIRLTGTDGAEIACDPERRLPVTDPFDRQIAIGFGAFLEIARIAAAQRGVAMDSVLFPDGESSQALGQRAVARLRFVRDPAMQPDPLYAAIVRRRSNKESYRTDAPVAAATLAQVARDGAQFSRDPAQIARLRRAILEAAAIEMHHRPAHDESVRLMRIGAAAVDRQPDGIALTGPMIEAGQFAGQIDAAQLADPASEAFRIGFEMVQQTYGSIPALLWITTDANRRVDQIEAGRRYVRANLRATQLGLAMHPMSQSLQEYGEVSGPFRAVHHLLGAVGEQRVQMLARVGIADPVGPSPRWPLETVLRP